VSRRGALIGALLVVTLPVARPLVRVAVAAPAPAAAATPAPSEPPAIDVADLPPLPAATDEGSSAATVLAASSAEEDVVVGAAKREQSFGTTASAVTVIPGDRLRRFGYRTIAEAIAATAGVYVQDDRLSTRVGIRGLALLGDFNTRILVLIDGMSTNEAWGNLSGVGFDTAVNLEDVARIEVIRGPVSSVYGANAFFGIINIVTRGAAETPRAWARIGASSFKGGSLSAGFAQGGVDRQLRGSIHAMGRGGEVLSLPEVADHLDHDRSTAFSAALVGSYQGTFAQVRAFRLARQSPFAPYDGDYLRGYTSYNTQVLADIGHTRELTPRLTVAARAYANLYQFNDAAPKIGEPSSFDTVGPGRLGGAELRARYELVPQRLGLSGGVEGNYDVTSSRAYFVADPAHTVRSPLTYDRQGVYAEVDAQPTGWLGFTGALRADRNSVLDDKLSPRAALFLSEPGRAARYGLKLLYAEGFRNPSAFEGFFDDGQDYKANPAIHAETIRSYEAVAWVKPRPGASARVSGFRWEADGIVEQQPYMGDPGLLQFQNIARYTSTGVEAEASFRNGAGWLAFGAATYARTARAGLDGVLVAGQVVNSPALSGSAGVSTPRLGGLVHLSTEVIVLGPRLTRVDGVESPAWAGWNATLYLPATHRVDVTLGVRNLLGVRDLMPAPQDYDRTVPVAVTVARLPGEGREIYAKVGYAF
jgi:iron complex outermembrane receptor protein